MFYRHLTDRSIVLLEVGDRIVRHQQLVTVAGVKRSRQTGVRTITFQDGSTLVVDPANAWDVEVYRPLPSLRPMGVWLEQRARYSVQ